MNDVWTALDIGVVGLYLICSIAGLYQALALVACAVHLLRPRAGEMDIYPPISILKPVHGREEGFYDAIASHARQDYPEFELLFGVSDPCDPAVEDIRKLQAHFPGLRIDLIVCAEDLANPKVSKLRELALHARFELLLVNDSDILVEAGYLRRIAREIERRGVGLVTCLYRARASDLSSVFVALGIATDFAPSTLVAPLAGVSEFGLGSTLLFRTRDLHRIGGYEAIADFVADDYQLGRRIAAAGERVHLAREVVETGVQDTTWSGVWSHQIRWQRMIRVSKGAGYAGLPVTFATLWATIAISLGFVLPGALLLSARMATGIFAGVLVLRCPVTARYWPLIPVRDLWGVAVWARAAFGRTVQWRGDEIELGSGGRILARAKSSTSRRRFLSKA